MRFKTCDTALSFVNNFGISWIIRTLTSCSEKDLMV